MRKQAQEQPQPQADPREEQTKLLATQISVNLKNPLSITKQIITTINLLMNDADYGPDNQALLSVLKNKYLALEQALENGMNKTAHIKVAQKVELPPTPSPDFDGATSLYSRLQMLTDTLKGMLGRQAPQMDAASNLIDQANNARAPWAPQYAPQSESWKQTQNIGWELDLLTKRASKKAYPIMHTLKGPPTSRDLDKWKKTAIQINAFKGVAAERNYTFPQVLYHFTSDWDMFERYDFKKWYRWNTKKANVQMKKTAFTVSQDRVQQWTQKRKKLMQRINLVRKALHELIASGLIDQGASNKIYKIIAMLEFEAMQLRQPKVAAARLRRAAVKLGKLGFTEGEELLKDASEEVLNPTFVKTAASDPKAAVDLLREIKKEMDSLSYSKHLDALFNIKKKLEGMGRGTDSEAIEKVIRDDLSVLEKLNKKLTDVYTNLSRVPLELDEGSDLPRETKEKVVEAPIEVTEEDIPRRQEKRPEGLGQPKVTPKPPAAAPAIETRIPNV